MTHRRVLIAVIAVLSLGTTSPAAPQAAARTSAARSVAFDRAVDAWLDAFARRHPSIAAGNGIHTYDGTMEDFSAASMAREVAALRGELARIAGFDGAALPPDQRVDRAILIGIIAGWLLDLDAVQSWKKNPMVYGDALFSGVHNLMAMESAPLDVRARRLMAKLRGVRALLAAARANVANPPPVYAAKGLNMMRGASAMLSSDVAAAFSGLASRPLADSLTAAATAAQRDVDAYATYLEQDVIPRATGSFAIGRANLEARYKAEELIDLPIATLLAIGERELHANQRAFREAAARIDPARSSAAIWHDVLRDHPKQGELIPAARVALADLTAFVIAKDLAGIPVSERPIVSAAPAFDLGLASSHASPPLEPHAVTSYYYITDAQASWPTARQDAWLQKFNRATLADITAHEVMPGHWLHSTWMRQTPGKVRRIWIGLNPFPQPSSGQDGWAHYAEQLVIDEGFHGDDPRYRLGQIGEALTRICRLISSARLHLGEWTVDDAAKFFETEAYLPAPAARVEAERGTYDPTNGGYFLGKLAALKLRRDVQAREGAAFTLRSFHERVMRNGIAPWWAHRQLLLPGDTGRVIE